MLYEVITCHILFVGHHDDGDAVFPVELLQHFHYFPGADRVEVASRLVWGYSISERIPVVLGSAPSYVAFSGYRVFLGSYNFV